VAAGGDGAWSDVDGWDAGDARASSGRDMAARGRRNVGGALANAAATLSHASQAPPPPLLPHDHRHLWRGR
jgi:hypothetical protein